VNTGVDATWLSLTVLGGGRGISNWLTLLASWIAYRSASQPFD
jgi:hypothetical protein